LTAGGNHADALARIEAAERELEAAKKMLERVWF